MCYATVMAEDRGLPVLQRAFVEGRLRFEQIRPVGRGHVLRQRFQCQQDCGLGVAGSCGLLREKRKREGLIAQSLVLGFECLRRGGLAPASPRSRLRLRGPRLAGVLLRPFGLPDRLLLTSEPHDRAGRRPDRQYQRDGRSDPRAPREPRGRCCLQARGGRPRAPVVSRLAASSASMRARSACRSFSAAAFLRQRRRLDIRDDLIVDLLPSRLQQLLGLRRAACRRAAEGPGSCRSECHRRASAWTRARVSKKAAVRVDDVSRARPAAQQRLVRHADDSMALGVLVADQKPGRDQRIDKSRLRRRSGHVGKRGWAAP